jgi:spermidine synthase
VGAIDGEAPRTKSSGCRGEKTVMNTLPANNAAENITVRVSHEEDAAIWIYLLFFLSGIPAILYQIVWQRALFSLYGINIESVTIVVSAFMLGLGLGSLGGGMLSKSKQLPLIALFGIAELGIAAFALASLGIFHFVAEHTRTSPLWITGIISFLLVLVPTILMGATLPLLTEHLVRRSRNVGSSVGALYFVNTLGSGGACVVAVRPLMATFGQAGTVRCAALVNLLVGVSALFYSFRHPRRGGQDENANYSPGSAVPRLLPFRLALMCAAFFGFAALSYELVWYRLLAFALSDTASTFASLLGSYLIGLALGSRFAEGYSERHTVEETTRILPLTILAAAVVSFWVNPISAWALHLTWVVRAPGGALVWFLFLGLICHAAMLFGALFPLIVHVAVSPGGGIGTGVSYLYAANIVGSTIGVLLVGFVLMDRFSLYSIAWLLLFGSILCAGAIASFTAFQSLGYWKFAFPLMCVAAVLIAPMSKPLFATIYDRLLFKTLYPTRRFSDVIENRSGVIGVTPDETLFGGGIYDGQFKVDLLNDTNIIVRPFALSAFHANPAHVLLVGLGSGSWAQVIANNPQVRDLTVVDINPGYLQAIGKHTATSSLLQNPKVTIAIDDGRRWLLRHPEASFDAIVMNTSFYWRNHSSNLLSTDFLRIVRPHLRPHGVFFYNTTFSDDVAATGLSVYPYALRVVNCLALSDSPIVFDRVRWKSILLDYSIDGKRVVNPNDPEEMKKLNDILNIPKASLAMTANSIEEDDEIRQRLKNRSNVIITDDNMGMEWR